MSATPSRWYWTRDGQRGGPISWGELQSMAASGRLRASDMVIREGSDRWQPAYTATDADLGAPPALPPFAQVAGPPSFTPAPPQGFAPSFMPAAGSFAQENYHTAEPTGAGGGVSPGKMIAGALICAAGVIGSVMSYNAAYESPTGGRYYIFTGPIIVGAAMFLRAFTGNRGGG